MKIEKDGFDYSNCDYRDTFEAVIADPRNRIWMEDVAEMFADPDPKWVRGLMALRNRIAGWFGLKTDAVPDDGRERIGMFEVIGRADGAMILGENDKHLDFRVLLAMSPDGACKRVSVSTLVKYNNRLGRVYFFFVKPFHRIIVPTVLKRKLRRLEAKAASDQDSAI